MKKLIIIICLISLNLLFSQPTNYKVNTSGTDPNEVSVAINPLDPNNLIAGANIRYVYYSTNGGVTWVQNNLTSTYGVWGDPCIVFDLNGHAYYGHLSNPSSPGYWIDRIVVQKSTNKGMSWSSGVGIGYNPPRKNQDKEWIAVDWTNSPYRNNIYMAWTEFDYYGSSNSNDSTRILFSRSTDGGNTWMTPVRISEKGGDCIDEDNTVEGAVPSVGPNGEVYLSWAGPLGLVFDKSLDGGVTWGADKVVCSIPGGWDFMVPGINRCNGLPITACDISNSPYRGNIYINWSDQRNGSDNTDIFIVKSTDGGNTWTAPKKVNQDNSNRHQFFCWMTVDPGTGYIYIIYYDRRNFTDNRTDVYISKSTDGGETFTDFKVNAASFLPTSSIFFGDYSNISALNGKVVPIWMALNNSIMSVWTAPFQDSISSTTTSTLNFNEGWNLVSVPLNSSNMSVNNLFPNRNSSVYGYQNNYYQVDSVKVGSGYWVKFPTTQSIQQSGQLVSNLQVNVTEGWNLIGSLNGNIATSSITTNPPNLISSPFYYFNNSYQVSDVLTKGQGYWVKVNGNGTLNLSISKFKVNNDFFKIDFEDFDKLIISDSRNSQTLYLSEKIFNNNYYELPPLPPAGNFDVRFSNNQIAQFLGEPSSIVFNSIKDYVKIKLVNGSKYTLTLLDEESGEKYQLINNREIKISKSNLKSLKITSANVIKDKNLAQNYPNPFNGATKIGFYIPSFLDGQKIKAVLKLYDILGREITTLYNNDISKVGYYSIDFEANKYNLSSGIYFYELKVFEDGLLPLFTEIKKMNYLK